MHVIFRESHGLEENETPTDLGQTPADLFVLSFSDSDLGAFAVAWKNIKNTPHPQKKEMLPSLRLANLAALKHPLSVDTYIENTLKNARGILVRIIGGQSYWPYGLQQLSFLAHQNNIALAILPADGRVDPALDKLSTLPLSTLRQLAKLCDEGGPMAAQSAIVQLSLAAGFYISSPVRPKQLPKVGAWLPEYGPSCPAFRLYTPSHALPVAVVFYRSYLVAADLDPIIKLFDELRKKGFDPLGFFVPSLKPAEYAGWLSRQISALSPVSVVNITAFSAKYEPQAADQTAVFSPTEHSPLDSAEVPVFQLALATSDRPAWQSSQRGLSPADLAMHVALPEVDGRIFLGVASFKGAAPPDPELEFSRVIHQAENERISAICQRIDGWYKLRSLTPKTRKIALILSSYPGKGWNMAHAIGLDALASAKAILEDLAKTGYDCGHTDQIANIILNRSEHKPYTWPLSEYLAELVTLPKQLRDDLYRAWGDPQSDPDITNQGVQFKIQKFGKIVLAMQPERGDFQDKDTDYHDLSRVPRHSYVAFYLWLKKEYNALVHIGAHGTLEWLPGKAVALSDHCWPEALVGPLPVIYPFIVNDPGEAAQAKRRISAITLGHIPPPMKQSQAPKRFIHLESLLDEFSIADGLDPKRRERLQEEIRLEAQSLGVESDLGIAPSADLADAITRIDRFVCDIKESQFGDGLHIWGRTSAATNCKNDKKTIIFDPELSALSESHSLINALDGKRISPGPAGSPYRGRADVTPTGRNLYSVDPRSIPSKNAYAQGQKLASELLRRHLQDHGEWPRNMMVDLWGSATMRTSGEEFAMALALIGVTPIWDSLSGRVSGIDVIPISLLEHPRIDVTLRISGLFRDVFSGLSALFSQAIRILSKRDESQEWNPYVTHALQNKPLRRVYGPAPGAYGVGMGNIGTDYSQKARARAAQSWLEASSWAFDGDNALKDDKGIAERTQFSDVFVHLQDLSETDLLMAQDYAAHEAGFAASQHFLQHNGLGTGENLTKKSKKAALYHLDNTSPSAPKVRNLKEEIARVVHARATNSNWIGGMKRHGFRGAAEIAATLENMARFAHLAGVVSPHLFDLFYDATLDNEEVCTFIKTENPQAFSAMQECFKALYASGVWETKRNSIIAVLEQDHSYQEQRS